MFTWAEVLDHTRMSGGDPPDSEQGGGVLGYGSYKYPRTVGSSGSSGGSYMGGAGGASLEIRTKTLELNGIIEMNGEHGKDGSANTGPGGGAGGSVLLRLDTKYSGTGTISVDGGNGGTATYRGGGGGGGRISIQCGANGVLGATVPNMTAYGGLGWEPGAN